MVTSTSVNAKIDKGYAAYYRPGLMEKVASNRGMSQAPCMIARPLRKDLGKWFWVKGVKTGNTLKCKVVDYRNPKHHNLKINKGVVVELKYNNVKTICGTYGATRHCNVKAWEVK